MMELTPDQKKYAVDVTVALVVEELAEQFHEEPTKMLKKFVASRTGALLYDEDAKLWWDGPSAIAEMYKHELNEKG